MPTDYTKTRAYALTDLLTKVVSSVALVALGVAGWLFQVQTEKARRAADEQREREQLYLPALQSLNEAEVVLDEVIYRLRHSPLTRSGRDQLVAAYYLGNRVRVAASAVFLPDSDPPRMTRVPLFALNPTWQPLPLKSALLMLAEMLRAPLQVSGRPDDRTRFALSPDGSELREIRGDSSSSRWHVMEGSLPAWRIVLGTRSVSPEHFIGPRLRWFAEDLRLHLAEASYELLRAHPDLGDKYVDIRRDIFRQIQDASTRRDAAEPQASQRPLGARAP